MFVALNGVAVGLIVIELYAIHHRFLALPGNIGACQQSRAAHLEANAAPEGVYIIQNELQRGIGSRLRLRAFEGGVHRGLFCQRRG